ncbi:MAG: hypothetical protein U5L03_08725 [Burkholderiaceae bacterium]|nr:hypothetical protein [Burkholderiaceae bacterium]
MSTKVGDHPALGDKALLVPATCDPTVALHQFDRRHTRRPCRGRVAGRHARRARRRRPAQLCAGTALMRR